MIIKMCNCAMMIQLFIIILINNSLSLKFTTLENRFSTSYPSATNDIVKNSLYLTGTQGKSALIHLKIKNSAVLYSLGLLGKDFVLMSAQDYKVIRINPDKSNEIKAKSVIFNSLKIDGAFKYNDIPQWQMVLQDSFYKNNTSLDWTHDKTFVCGHHNMLGGQCQLSTGEITKQIQNLPKHTMIRIEALYHFLGSWDSHTGYLKVSNSEEKTQEFIWANRCKNAKSPFINIKLCSVDVCKIAAPISVSINHTANDIKFIFGSTLTDNPCYHSYGISDVKLYIR